MLYQRGIHSDSLGLVSTQDNFPTDRNGQESFFCNKVIAFLF